MKQDSNKEYLNSLEEQANLIRNHSDYYRYHLKGETNLDYQNQYVQLQRNLNEIRMIQRRHLKDLDHGPFLKPVGDLWDIQMDQMKQVLDDGDSVDFEEQIEVLKEYGVAHPLEEFCVLDTPQKCLTEDCCDDLFNPIVEPIITELKTIDEDPLKEVIDDSNIVYIK